jgi:hypothetical protein
MMYVTLQTMYTCVQEASDANVHVKHLAQIKIESKHIWRWNAK